MLQTDALQLHGLYTYPDKDGKNWFYIWQ